MVLRLNGADSMIPNCDRSNEINIWQAASKKGIAPPLLHVDEQQRFLVNAYIQNSTPSEAPFDESFVNQAIELLKNCHQLDVDATTIDYISHIEQYWDIIESKKIPVATSLRKQRDPMRQLLEEILNSDALTGLCHHDPVVANFVGNMEKLYLVDWEYAAHGLLVMDFAALATEWKLGDKVILERTGIGPELLMMARNFYCYECQLWEVITGVG